MEKKRSGIDWLKKQYYQSEGKLTRYDFEQAEAMHKEEIEEAYGHGQNNGYMYANQRAITISKENYFKQTFGGDNETH